MKVIENNPDSWGDKVNFVDRNNTLVGFDISSSCCESFGWSISEKAGDISETRVAAEALDGYDFDTGTPPERTNRSVDEGGEVSFRLVADGQPDLWLTIFNHHNGYYSHGFTFDVGGKRVMDDSI